MIYQPTTIEQLTVEIARASAAGEQGANFKLDAFNRILEHTPEDMTVTVEAGLTLVALQEHLAERGQWLPIDPPNPHTASIADILNSNASGPRRFGYGTIREHLLGLKVVLANGRLIHCGGKVVKNVAGYDLCKLFVSSGGSLGVLIEATFKVRPLPEAEQFVGKDCESLSQAGALLEAIHHSELSPVVLDLHNVADERRPENVTSAACTPIRHVTPAATGCCLALGLAGTREEVEWQVNKAAELGMSATADLGYEKTFWSGSDNRSVQRISVLPSRLAETLQKLGATQFVARAGNGVIYYAGGEAPPKAELPLALIRRIKETYDPKHTLPDFPELTL